MKAIYASKLYKASPRKEKIRAAIQNPVNAELVTQLSEYLDEEYQTPQYLEGKPSADGVAEGADGSSAEGTSSGGASGGGASGGGFAGGGSGGSGGGTDMHMDDVVLDKDGNPIEGPEDAAVGEGGEVGSDVADDSLDAEGVDDFDTLATEGEADFDEIEEATDIEGVDSTLVDSREVDPSNKLHDAVGQPAVTRVPTDATFEEKPQSKEEELIDNNVESIKLMLNAEEETEGVERISLKNSELWIYYNDFVNLNNIMSPVIEFFARGSFTYLEFNRLARSANAIVFQVCTGTKR